jgi:hypothetical protein
MKIKDLIIIAVFLIGLYSCKQTEITFDKELWSKTVDGFYEHREQMVKDLMENRLNKGLAYHSVIDLLGKSANFANLDSNTIGYEVFVDYGWSIDPVETKTLLISFSSDSTIRVFKLKHWKN